MTWLHRSRHALRRNYWHHFLTAMILLLYASLVRAEGIHIDQAELESNTGTHEVSLPHVLTPDDFDAGGTEVHYRMHLHLDNIPTIAPGVFVSKMSLSGSLSLNGALVQSCELGALRDIRCLHQPQLFVPPLAMWRQGDNLLDFTIYATARQANGITAIEVDDAEKLFRGPFVQKYWWKVSIVKILTWISLTLGIITLLVGLSLPRESAYLWFGLASIINAVASLNPLVTRPLIDIDWFNWLIFVSRLVSVPLFLMTCLALFGETKRWQRTLTLTFTLLAPVIIAFSNTNRQVVFLCYVPLVLASLALAVVVVRRTLQTRHWTHIAATAMILPLYIAGLFDWLRLGGYRSFDGVYLSSYTYAGMMLLMGAMLVKLLVSSLLEALELRTSLEEQVSNRTQELLDAYRTIHKMERTALQVTEAIPVGTYVIEVSPDHQARMTFVSKRCLELLQVTQEAILADTSMGFGTMHPDDHEHFAKKNREALATRQPFFWEGRTFINGEVRWLSIEAIPRPLPGGWTAFEGVIIDVTAYKETQAKLELAHAELTRAAVERSKLEEREQLLQDMHDGFGSQLATARLLAEQGRLKPEEISPLLQECLADLYLVADTLGESDKPLADALADFRFRTSRRLASIPLQMHWAIALETIPVLPPRTVLPLLRIIQEALNNAVKHSRAGNIFIDAQGSDAGDRLSVTIRDDGTGLPEQVKRGRGLNNMQQRARQIGATLTFDQSHTGLTVRLILPLRMPNPA